MRKKVFLYAYDNLNLGDDLFIHTIVKRYPNVKFYIWTDKRSKKTFKTLSNLKVLDKNSQMVRVLVKIRPSLLSRYKSFIENRCKAVVYIGGSLFIEYDNWKNILSWWEYEAINRPFYVIGANFGPYKNEAYKEKLGDIFSNMRDVCFRDRYSYEHFKHINSVRVAPDILFSYEFPSTQLDKKQVFVSVIDCEKKEEGNNKLSCYDEIYVSSMSNIILEYLGGGYEVVLSSFCPNEGDEKTIDKIMGTLQENPLKKNIITLNYDGTNIEKITKKIVESEIVIASRFHAAILGFAADRPVFPIVYSDKTIHVLEDIGFKGIYMDIRKLESMEYHLLGKSLQIQKISSISKLKKSALKHFCKLDEMFK